MGDRRHVSRAALRAGEGPADETRGRLGAGSAAKAQWAATVRVSGRRPAKEDGSAATRSRVGGFNADEGGRATPRRSGGGRSRSRGA